MNGPGSHQHRGLGITGRYRAVVGSGASSGPHTRPTAPPHPRGGWHPHNQHSQHTQLGQQYAGNKEYPYRQCPSLPRYHNGYITHLWCITGASSVHRLRCLVRPFLFPRFFLFFNRPILFLLTYSLFCLLFLLFLLFFFSYYI